MDVDEYEAMAKAQDYKCKICFSEDPNNRNNVFYVDHKHTGDGGIRALLCQSCNFLLGNARDNIDILLSAIEYLKEHSG